MGVQTHPFMKNSTPVFKKVISVYLSVSLLASSFFPTQIKAITGPSSPEFSNFEPVSTNDLVNKFSGDFTYNIPLIQIPGPDGAGYALSLSYKSGTSPEDDASWVGYGWTLSPGAIIRGKNGFPDDAKEVPMTSYNDIPLNWTLGLGMNAGVSIEGFSLSASIGETTLLQYNSNMGLSYTAIPNIGVGLGYGLVSLNLAVKDGGGSLSAAVNPAAVMNFFKKDEEKSREKNAGKVIAHPAKATAMKQCERFAQEGLKSINNYSNAFISYACDNTSRNSNISEFTGSSFKLQVGVQYEPVGTPIGLGADLFGTYSYQKAEASKDYDCYGYLYSANLDDETALMDYYTEKDQGFNKRDLNLSIPWARPDQFILMGEGLSGSFRAFSKNVGHFRMNEKENKTTMYQLGIDVMAGLDLGVGASFQTGDQSTSVGDWDDNGANDNYNFSNSGDEPFLFSFMMDNASNMSFGGDELDFTAQEASLNETNSTPGAMSYEPKMPSSLSSTMQVVGDNDRVARSSEVICHTNSQMTEVDNGNHAYNRYSSSKESQERYLSRSSYPDQIGEFVVYNNTGNRYVYGLPVYSKEESSLSYNITNPSKDYIVTETIEDKSSDANYKKVGDYTATAYANSFLLTNITTPYYIDRTMDGPSNDDFGGWTKFRYAKKYGDKSSTGKWFQWRVPYNGLYNNPGSLSDDDDDMGSFSSGKKEMYYLDSIETKTNLAIFYRSTRKDGLDAKDDVSAAASLSAKGSNTIEKLDSIYLYSKNSSGAIVDTIKRIYFNYDYSLMQGIPNTSSTTSGSKGVLTLKNVWFEYGGVYNSKLSPYTFSYSYPQNLDATKGGYLSSYPPAYADLLNYADVDKNRSLDLNENPDYNKCNIDRWGNYQYGGATRLKKLNPWVDQVPDSKFDPAAWQLKAITLPTGGQIHVQYEQDDYQYVQDRKAMAMVSIKSSVSDNGDGAEGTFGDKFYLNLDSLGITSSADKDALVSQLKNQFIYGEAGQDPEKIYFKFLYSLMVHTADLNSCGSDYITGYVDVADVGSDATGVYLMLGSSKTGYASLETFDADETYSVPRQVCIDFYDKTRQGNLNSKDLACQAVTLVEGDEGECKAEEAIYDILGIVSNLAFENHATLCLDIDEANSYLRIPVLNSKKGGGLRVKRLMLYDSGVESNDANLYGKEYVYQNTDGKSSGVATNEPAQGREECALVKYIDKRKDSEWYQKAISGEDLEQFEGPMGEGILPGASVGYSRVAVKNIHSDKNTNDGFSVDEFYTTYDYPFDGTYSYTDQDNNKVSYNGVDQTEMTEKADWLPIYALIYNRVVSNIWASQGYRFIVNDMNGKPKKQAVYSGSYDYINDPSLSSLTSGVEYTYYQPGEPVKVVNRWEWANEADIVPEYRILGKQMDVVTESRAIKDHLNDYTLELDASIGFWGPVVIPWITGMLYVNETVNELYTHTLNKVVYLPTPLKSIRKFQDGIYVDTKQEFFDANTGEAMVNITNDGYNNLTLDGAPHDGRYVNYSFPASHYYKGEGVRATSDQLHLTGPADYTKYYSGTAYYLEYTGANSCALEALTPGDLIATTRSGDNITEVYNVGEIIGKTVELLPNGDFYYDNTAGPMSDITIVRTAKTNQLSEKVGSLATYGGYPNVTNVPIDESTLDARQQVADALNTMSASSGSVTSSLSYSNVYIMSGDTCVALSTKVTTSHSNETAYYNDYDTIVTCTPVACSYKNTGTTTGGTTSTTTNVAGTNTTGSSTGNLTGTTTNTNDNTTNIAGTNNNKGTGNSASTDATNLANPPSNETYTYNYGTHSYMCWNCDTSITAIKKSKIIPKETLTVGSCTLTFTYDADYRFYIDDATGELMYGDENNPCDAVRVDCFDFCPNEFASIELDGVVSSSAIWIADDWDMGTSLNSTYSIPSTDLNKYEYGAKGKWHSEYTYNYNTPLSNIHATSGKTWNSGIYDDFKVFNWDYEEANDSTNWIKYNTTTKISPNSSTLEEKNALDIYSSMKMGYNSSVPYLVASNSNYENVMFESFENHTSGCSGASYMCFEDGYSINTASSYYGKLVADTAHTGKESLRMGFTSSSTSSGSGMAMIITKTYSSELALQPITLNDQVINKGVSVKFWLKSDKALTELSLKYNKYVVRTGLTATSTSFSKIAQVGEWTLYEAKITDFGSKITTVASTVTPSIYFKYSGLSTSFTSSPKIYVDDIRMQPLDAQVSAYVYDPNTLKIIASFDDQHFGLFYQYNTEGKLIRKLKETMEGIKTVTETEYNIPLNTTRPY